MTSSIETINLTKTYRGQNPHTARPALDGVTFDVQPGEIAAVLGLNGAGKSTLMKILLDLVRPTSGKVFLFGKPVQSKAWKQSVGYLPESFHSPPAFTAERLLRYLGQLSGMRDKRLADRISDVLENVGLTENRSRRVGTFSKGMVTSLGIAQALLHEPQLVFLDEPTEGLDPAARKRVRGFLHDLRAGGASILVNSHVLSEIEFVADRIIILHKGRIAANGTLADLLPRGHSLEVEISSDPGSIGQWKFRAEGPSWICEVAGMEELHRLLADLNTRSISISSVKPKRITLEDVFFTYVGGEP